MASTTIWRWWSEIVDDGDDGGEIVGSGDNCDGEDKIFDGVEAKNCKLLLMKVIGGKIVINRGSGSKIIDDGDDDGKIESNIGGIRWRYWE